MQLTQGMHPQRLRSAHQVRQARFIEHAELRRQQQDGGGAAGGGRVRAAQVGAALRDAHLLVQLRARTRGTTRQTPCSLSMGATLRMAHTSLSHSQTQQWSCNMYQFSGLDGSKISRTLW